MVKFIDEEYFISSMFFERKAKYISFDEINDCVDYVQKEIEKQDEDLMLIVTESKKYILANELTEYFEYSVDNKGIRLKKGKRSKDCVDAFKSYVPVSARNFLQEAIDNFYEKRFDVNSCTLVKVNKKKIMSMEELVDMFKDSAPSVIINIILGLTDCKIKDYSKIKEEYFKTYDNGTEEDFENSVFRGRDLTLLKAVNVLLRNYGGIYK